MKRLFQLEYSSAINNIVESNSSFDKARLLIAYTGKNRNNTFISKESFEKAIPTAYNCPVVARYTRTDDGGELGEHEGEFITNPDGSQEWVNITQPVGVIPESATWSWETIDDNGTLHEYLSTDVLLWKRQEAYKKIKNDGIVKQSMEINVSDGSFKDGCYHINSFEFTAFCLLGSAEPCFESAALFTFSQEEEQGFRDEMREMLNELKDYYALANENIITKEVNDKMNKFEELLAKYNLTKEDIKFDYTDMSDEELEARFSEEFENTEDEEVKEDVQDQDNEEESEEPAAEEDVDKEDTEEEIEAEEVSEESDEAEADDEGSVSEESYALNSDLRNQLSRIIANRETYTESYGDYEYTYSKYYMWDFDTDLSEVYYECYEEDKGYVIYGAKYTLNGDDVSIDFDNEKRKKITLVDYINGENPQVFTNVIFESHRALFDAYKKNYDEYQSLSEYKTKIDDEQKEALFNEFESKIEKFGENSAFNALKENKDEYTVEALRKELFALYGEIQMNLSEKPGSSTIGINVSSEDFSVNSIKDPYGDYFTKYGYTAHRIEKEDK